jgi:hypothetical protein
MKADIWESSRARRETSFLDDDLQELAHGVPGDHVAVQPEHLHALLGAQVAEGVA